jgi:hypothetical protein
MPERHTTSEKPQKPIWKAIVLCNTPRFKLKPEKPAKNNPSLIVIPKKQQRIFQTTTFSQHGKSKFNIRKLKSWLNKRARIRVFFETHYEKNRARLATKIAVTMRFQKTERHRY